MKDLEFNTSIESLKNISLSQSEKESLRTKITSYADFHTPTQTALVSKTSPWKFFHTHSAFALRALSLILLIGGTSYLAQGALPGDLLYPFKLRINEELYGSFIQNTEAKQAWNSERLITRVKEAEVLIQKDSLTEESLSHIEQQIDSQFGKITQKISKNQPEVSLMMATRAAFDAPQDPLVTQLIEQKQILENLTQDVSSEQKILIQRLLKKLDEKIEIRQTHN